jgi:hypothetical protein
MWFNRFSIIFCPLKLGEGAVKIDTITIAPRLNPVTSFPCILCSMAPLISVWEIYFFLYWLQMIFRRLLLSNFILFSTETLCTFKLHVHYAR